MGDEERREGAREAILLNAAQLKALQAKLASDPNFPERCAQCFYEELFTSMPGAETLFRDPGTQLRMFSLMVDLIISAMTDEEELRRLLGELGYKHRMAGVQSVHMKAGRAPLLTAVRRAYPGLDDVEVAFFDVMYAHIVSAMRRA